MLAGVILSGFGVRAQLFRDAYVIQTVHVFPAAIEATGWENAETLTFQNLEQYSLLQDFNAINSATLREVGVIGELLPEAPAVDTFDLNIPQDEDSQEAEASEAESTPDTDATLESEPTISEIPSEQTTDGTAAEETPTPVLETPEATVIEPAPAADAPSSDSEPAPESAPAEGGAVSLFERVNSFFRLAAHGFATIVLATTTTATEEPAASPVAPTLPESETQSTPEPDTVAEPEPLPTEVVPSEPEVDTPDVTTNTEAISVETSTATETELVLPATPSESFVPVTTSAIEDSFILTDNLLEGDVTNDAFVGCTENCGSHVITLNNFAHPLETGVEVSGAQLRLSLAAARKVNRDRIPALTIQYSINGGASWINAGSVLLEDQVSNSINGGYFLFALPEVVDQTSLNNLSVQIRYDDDMNIVEQIFIDSVWLELFTLERPTDLPPTDIAKLLADDGFDERVLSGDELTLPTGETITFNFTDNNDDETLIIKSDRKTYSGLTEVTTYFSVTNTTSQPDSFSVNAYFPNGVGTVNSLEVFNQNKPRQVVIPEYRPYVYHCNAGWEAATPLPDDLNSLSQELSSATSNDADTPVSVADLIAEANTLNLAGDETATSASSSVTDEAVALLASTDTLVGETATSAATETALEPQLFSCLDTSVVQQCDYLDGDGTACVRERVLVEEHEVTQFAPGWDTVPYESGAPEQPGFFGRVASFLGFGPNRKEVPDTFEVRAHTPDEYIIQPGETKYFKMEIGFEAFSTGEYWIEAVGDSEYGLLDPFWNSDWTYRMPIQIANPTNQDQTEYQIFMELTSALTDFWANVNSDGSDIRFVQELPNGNFSDRDTAVNNWLDFSFGRRVPIEIPAGNVDADVTNFPVTINLANLDSEFWNNVRSDGGDIRVFSTADVELPIDLVSIDTTAQTGELHFLADTITAAGATTFYLYYDNPSLTGYAAGDPLGSEAVWADYEAVYHFEESASTVGAVILDATANSYDLTVTGAALATTSGQFGTAIDFTAGAGYLQNTSWTFPGGDPLIATGMYRMSAAVNESIFQWGTGAQPQQIQFQPWYGGDDGRFTFGQTTGDEYINDPFFNPSVWHSFGLIGTTSNTGTNLVFENGELSHTIAQSINNPSNTNTAGFQVGRLGGGGSWSGFIEELRIATTSRSEAFVKAESLVLQDPNKFSVTRQSQTPDNAASRSWYSTSWEGRVRISIPAARLDADLTDFPVYVDLGRFDSDFFARVAADGRDIRVTEGDGVTELPFELVGINTSAETGELYFKTNLSDSAANDFYIYFDNSDAVAYARDAVYGSENVWTNGFEAVYHFEESAAGTGNPDIYLDSTANQYHGDDEVAATGKTGLFGAGQEFGLNSTDRIVLPHQAMDGLTDVSVSWWHNATNNQDMTILSGANAAQANEFWTRLDNSTTLILYSQGGGETFTLDNPTTYNNGTWQHFLTTSEDAIDEMNLYRNGVPDNENPDPQPISALNIDPGGLIIGQDQDIVGGNFSTAENFEGFLDELRIASVIRSGDWAAAEYANMADQENFVTVFASEELTATQFVELDFWVQHFDATAEEADIWVQVAALPANQEAVIYLYYGNSAAVSASDELATFSYSTSTPIYHVVDNSGADQISVVSLVDNNEVTLDGGTPVALNAGERTTFTTFSAGSVISVLGPISGTLTDNQNTDGSDTIVPIGFASTTQAVATNRGTEQYYIKAPFASTTVRSFEGGSGAPAETVSIATGSVATLNGGNPAGTDAVIFEATSPILVMHSGSGATAQDGLVAYPPTTRDLFGIYSNNLFLTTLLNGANPSVRCSSGTTGTVTGLNRGLLLANTTCTNGAEGAGNAVRFFNQSAPIVATQQADSDGNESTVFWPQHEFGTVYAMSNNTAYVAVTCSPRFGSVNLEVLDTTGSVVASGSCVPSGQNPGKAYFGTDGDTQLFAAGHLIRSTNGVPFYAVYEDITVDQDEKNIVGPVQARKYDGFGVRELTFGPQQLANDALYDQHSFSWYENADALTPTDNWPINPTERVSEGQAIRDAGAVDNGDVLRLRLSLEASSATGTAGTTAFNLQYATAEAGQCTTAAEWANLGEQGSTTAAFSGFNNGSVPDGATIGAAVLASTTVLGTYEERNFSNFLPSDVGPGDIVEYDWAITATNIEVNTNYCFRMVKADGNEFVTYTVYPELETVGPPNTPDLFVFFDNERTTISTPVLEFVATDNASDDIHYQIQIDDDINFGSVELDRNSDDHFTEFENLAAPADKSPFTSGQRVRFTGTSQLSTSTATTYWYRVRASDPNGSATSSDWSESFSFTIDESIVVTEWFQTTSDQFNTNELINISTTSLAGSASVVGSNGVMITNGIDFDDATVGNAWGEVAWVDTETSGDITIQVEYNNNGTWTLVPNELIPGNDVGVSTSPINLLSLDTSTYNELRLIATFTGTSLSLQEWVVRWGLRVETPVQGDPFDNEKIATTVPIFDFISSDPQGDDIEYEISFSQSRNFTSSTTYNSSTSAQFQNISNGGDTSPFNSGERISFTTPGGSPFTDGETYWWRTRAKDPAGGDSWSPWSEPDAFTVDTAVTESTWFQTTREQFEQGILDGTVATSSGSVVVSNNVGEYGTVTLTNNNWQVINTTNTYSNMVVVASPEFDFDGFLNGRTVRVRNKTANSFEIKVDNYLNSFSGSTVVDFIVIEAGDWEIDNGSTGFRIVAGTRENVSARKINSYANGSTEVVAISPAFSSNPGILATISSDNDSNWISTHVDDGTNFANEITTSQFGLALGQSKQTSGGHSGSEDIDWLVFEQTSGTNNAARLLAINSPNVVTGAAAGNAISIAGGSFTAAPGVTVVHNNGDNGAEGGFAMKETNGTNNANTLTLAIQEMGPTADGHIANVVSVLAFEGSSGQIARRDGGALSGTIAGEDIIFSDGAGPKYDNFSWSATTPGASSIRIQMQYRVSAGVYAPIPNSQIPGNSTGITSSPIDLTNVDVNLYPEIRAFATLDCVGVDCPTLNDWQLEWSQGVNMSGTLQEYDRTTPVASGTIRAAVNGVPVLNTGTVSGGVWSLTNVTAFAGQIVTVWVDGAAEEDEAVTSFVYDGSGDMTGVALFEQHLSFAADETGTITNALLALNDSNALSEEDIFYNVDGSNNLVVCASGTCDAANIYIGPGITYVPASSTAASVSTHDVINDGRFELDANTINVSGSWINNASTSVDTSTVNLTATSGTESIASVESPLRFHNLSFGSGSGTTTFTIGDDLDLSGNLTVAAGTLQRDGFAIALAGNLTTGANGFWAGTGTTTFDGAGSKTWTDNNAVSQNVGSVIIDGAATFVTVPTDVTVYDIRIGSNDTLAGSAGNTIFVAGDFINTGTYLANSGTVEIIPDNRTYPDPIPGSADWYADTSFEDRLPLIINSGEVSGTVTNFPIYVDLATLGSDFWNNVQSDGDDIRITAGDGQTELPYEIVSFNSAARTGELHFLADSISSATNTTFYIYHNNPSASGYAVTHPFGRNAVWAEYEAVYHFNGDPTSISNVLVDATGNGNDLVVVDAALATSTGQLGLALNMNSINGLLRDTDFHWTAGNPLTSSGWYRMSAASNEAIWQFGTGAQPNNLYFEPWDSGSDRGQYIFGNTGGSTYNFSPRDTVNWNHFTTIGATTTGASNLVYHDTILRETQTQTVANPSNTTGGGIQIGRTGTTGYLNAEIDELRFAPVIRNTDWITTEYNNQNAPAIFYSTSTIETYQPEVILDQPTHTITTGGSAFFNFIANDATTTPVFTEPSVVVTNDFTIATGTITLPTDLLTVGGSFTNNGFFQHNNGEVLFTSASAETITLNATGFFNAFFDVRFTGAGTFTFIDTNASTTNNIVISNGQVVFPSGTLEIGGSLSVTGAGSFNANGGTVIFTSSTNENITTNGSDFYNVTFGAGGAGLNWYDLAWGGRSRITITPGTVAEDLSNFPVYLDLSTLSSSFWDTVASDGADIRMTAGDGTTEIPFELVSIDTGSNTGELHFRANSIAAAATSTFYIYYDNTFATAYNETDPFGAQNVWTNGYTAVYHFAEAGVAGRNNSGVYLDSTANNYHAEDDTLATGTTGYLGSGVEFRIANGTGGTDTFDHLNLPTSVLAGVSEFTVSMWYQSDNGSGTNDPTFVGGYSVENEIILRVENGTAIESFINGTENNTGPQTIANINDGVWRQFAYTYADDVSGDFAGHFVNGAEVFTDTTGVNGAALTFVTNGLVLGCDLDGAGDTTTGVGECLDGFVDEARFANVVRSDAWLAAEYATIEDPGSFYTTSPETLAANVPIFTLNEANTTVTEDIFLNGSVLVAPSNTLLIGGSASNAAGTFNPNNATTTFNSTDVGETFDFGDVVFWNLSFNGVGGGWTVSTTTVENDLTLVTGASYVQASGTTMTVGGVFTNSLAAANTTWADSTLVLTGGDYTVTSRLESGDDYGTVEVSGDSDIVIWNSSIATSSIQDTSSLYMPDYAGVDGELRIYGEYARATGTEYWNYTTDFDGTDISGTPRAATVLIASSSVVTIESALEMVGLGSASTSVGVLGGTGTYMLVASSSAVSGQYFEVAGTGSRGLELLGGTTLGVFSDGAFTVASGSTGMTVDAATIEAQPSTEYERFYFDAVSGSPTNITLEGIPAGFWRFAGGSGTIYGEAFDADDGDPGAIQWDDSNFTITISGRVRTSDGSAQSIASVCDGITETVRVVVDGTTTYQTACDPTDGSYSVSGISFTGEPKILAYLENDSYGSSPTDVTLVADLEGTEIVQPNSAMTVPRPAVIDGDLLVVIVGKDETDPVNPPAGWAEAAVAPSAAGNGRFVGLWYRTVVDAATEPTEYYFFNGDADPEEMSYWIGSFRGAENNNPFEVVPAWVEDNDDTTPEAPSQTTTVSGSYALAAWYVDNDAGVTMPGGVWTTLANNVQTGGFNLSVAGQPMPTPGTTGDAILSGLGVGDDTTAGQFIIRRAERGANPVRAVTVSQTPIGVPTEPIYNTVSLRDDATGFGTVAGSATFSVTRPTVADGDVLVVIAGREDDFSISAPSGWVLEDEQIEATGNQRATGIWYKVVTDAASEPASYDFTNNDPGIEEYAYWIGSFSNVDTTDIFFPMQTWQTINDDITPTALSVTVNRVGSYALGAWFVINDNATDFDNPEWSLLADDVNQAGQSLTVVGKTVTQAGGTGDLTLFNLGGGDDTLASQFILNPTPVSVPSEIRDFDLYENQVIVRHEDLVALTIADMALYDNDDENDILFTASTSSSPDLLTVLGGSGLYVWGDKEFAPGGEITLQGGGAFAADGSFTVGPNGTFTSSDDDLTVGGSFFVGAGGSFAGGSSLVTFTATNTGQQIGAAGSSTITFSDLAFTGIGGGWAVQTPIISQTGIALDAGTVSGVANITVQSGDFAGNGLLTMTGGTVTIEETNTLGGINGWTFNNLTLGDGVTTGVTTPASAATTTIRSQLTIRPGHFLAAGSSTIDLIGSGTVFIENGTFQEQTSTVRYSGATPSVTRTAYYNLVIDTNAGGSVVATAPAIGLQVLNDFTIGQFGTSTLNLNTNDPVFGIGGDVYIGPLGTIDASATAEIQAFGSWDNDGVFTANGGEVRFLNASAPATIAAGNSPFGRVSVLGAGTFTFTESATSTGNFTLGGGSFTLASGQTLAVGGAFTNNMNGLNTTWSGTTLRLFSGTAYTINTKSQSDTYDTLVTENGTHVRLWNATTSAITTNGVSSVYAMDYEGVDGALAIFGDFVSSNFSDHWSYATDFDGVALPGSERAVTVTIEDGGSVRYEGGSLSVLGTSTASTTIGAAGSGTYQFTIGGTTDVLMNYYVLRDTDAAGLTFAGTPEVADLSFGDFLVEIAGGSAMTVGGTVINANQARNFTDLIIATTSPIAAFNVTATGTSVSSWRFVNVDGNLDGEALDNDPGGDPGYLVWEDSAAIINISGTVYSDAGVTPMGPSVCDGTTNNIVLSIQGLTFASTSCDGTGFYEFVGIGYGPSDTLTVYINDEAEKAVTVTQDPISSIGNMDLYQNRVIVRHESGAPMTIADMEAWDSDDDADILFDVETVGTDTLVLDPNTELVIWTDKEFRPNGNVTISGGGAGDPFDGSLVLQAEAIFRASSTETHTVGGSITSATDALFVPAQSTFTFTTTGSGRTIDTNGAGFNAAVFSGTGSWTITDPAPLFTGDVTITAGAVTLPASATTTLGGSFQNTGGSFVANAGLLNFTATDTSNIVRFGGSDTHQVRFAGAGGAWTMSDTVATTTNTFTVATGTVTLPTGRLAVGDDFTVTGAVIGSTGTLELYGTGGGNVITLNGSDLNDLFVNAGAGDYTFTEVDATLLGDLTIGAGSLTVGTGTLAIGGSFDATGGTFVNNNGTILFNAGSTGQTVAVGSNELHSVIFSNPLGGWTLLDSATTTNNFTLQNAASFTLSSSTTLYVGGVFTNQVGGAATTWTGSTLVLDSGTEYEISPKTVATEQYATLIVGANTDISSWNSAATTVQVDPTASWYSQDHAASNGALNIYGDYHISTTTEHWSFATDFDGVSLGGSPRAVTVSIASSSSVTVDGGALRIIGAPTGTTTITNQGTGRYNMIVTDGTFNANTYVFRNLSGAGLQISGTPNITSLSNGDFEQADDSTTLITLTDQALNENAGLIITNTRFDRGGNVAGTNVSLNATTTNSWTFTGALGNLWGENFDIDGTDDCSSIRWSDSNCLLTEQLSYRWRNDDGGEGAIPSTWFDANWDKRKRVRVINPDATTYTNVAVKVNLVHEASMQNDFDDIRFTDSSGTTTIPYWRERFSTGVEAQFWVLVDTLPASGVVELYAYYDNTTATTTSDANAVFVAVDTFDDNNISEYSGNVSQFGTGGTFAYGGGFGLDASPNPNARSIGGIRRTDLTVAQGNIIRYMQYVDVVAGAGDEVCTMFGVQTTANQNYAACLSPLRDRVSIVRNVVDTDSSGTRLASSSVALATGWYEVEIDWQTNNEIDVTVFDDGGAVVATTSATDSTYTSGGIGFTFWFQHGGWDSYVAWPRTNNPPVVRVGGEQTIGGATWAGAQDTPTGGYLIDETARLRIGIDNSGLDITNQNFRLEFAPKGVAPTCAAVPGSSYAAVPPSTSCGSSEICMTTSANVTNGNATTDHLVNKAGTFVAGRIVADTTNQTTAFDLDQGQYTELEYALRITPNAVNDAYCFRVTDAGSPLDSYATIPELTLQFDPILDPVVLNGGADITLSVGTTTTIIASTTVTDFNGFGDLVAATTTFYTTSATAACTPNDNNCYVATSSCSFLNCAGNSCTLSCAADFAFHANATDNSADEWFAFMEAEDSTAAVGFNTSTGVDLLTLLALNVQNAINYGTLDVNQNTGSFNPEVDVINLGNDAIDVQVAGTDMSDGVASIIPASQQLFATSTFTYDSCVSCLVLDPLGTPVELDLAKPTAVTPPVADNIFWGIEVPFGTASNPHSGVNTFTVIPD